jgi:hypothetical protein
MHLGSPRPQQVGQQPRRAPPVHHLRDHDRPGRSRPALGGRRALDNAAPGCLRTGPPTAVSPTHTPTDMPARAAASPITAASSELNRTHTDALRAASARARRRAPDTALDTGSLLATTPSLSAVWAVPVPRYPLPDRS